MDQIAQLQYPSSIEKITECNESFDSGVIRICYPGKNNNGSNISREAIEEAIPSIYNCPIVCNYDAYEDSIGGHDIDFIVTENGMRKINLTDAIGVIPAGANYYWETVDDGTEEHEYFCVEAILWKRSAAYSKIRRDGIVSQSMEITIKEGRTVDGYYCIDRFIFTAFCLLGEDVKPCFESASLEVFSLNTYKTQFARMMDDFEASFLQVTPSQEDDIENQTMKGGVSLERIAVLSEFGLTAEDVDFNFEEMSVEELREKLEFMQKSTTVGAATGETDTDPVDNDNVPEDNGDSNNDVNYSLTGEQFRDQLIEALSAPSYQDPYWGEVCKYGYVDYDCDAAEVYCYDYEDWNLYGFKYTLDGDNVVIDWESKKRKKFSIVDFEEGSTAMNYQRAFSQRENAVAQFKDNMISEMKNEHDAQCRAITAQLQDANNEIDELKQFKSQRLDAERATSVASLFTNFAELDGIEAFEDLRNNCSDMTLEAIESKCYEIRGRNPSATFSSTKPKSVRIATDSVNQKSEETEPYNGLFRKYGYK